MGKKRICKIRVLKNICYFLVPIVLIVLITSIISVSIGVEKNITVSRESYFNTKIFEQRFLDDIYYILYDSLKSKNIVNIDNETSTSKITVSEIELQEDNVIHYKPSNSNIKYLIIDSKNNIYTNSNVAVQTKDEQNLLKNELLTYKNYWIYENKNIKTSVKENYENKAEIDHIISFISKQDNCSVYISFDDSLKYSDSYFRDKILFDIVKIEYKNAIFIIPISAIFFIAMIIIILIGIGKTNKQEEVYLNSFDKIHLEFVILLLGICAFVTCLALFSMLRDVIAVFGITLIIICTLILYLLGIAFVETFVKRIKAKMFIKTTFVYFIYNKLKLLFQNMNIFLKPIIFVIVFGIENCIGFLGFRNEPFIGVTFLSTIYCICLVYILKKVSFVDKIKRAIDSIYKGNMKLSLNENEFTGIEKQTAIEIKDIAGGMSNAVEEKIKSERLKTELITNVSHDIKTPLTSIINYVDLLKKEGLGSERAGEYLEVLDNKSQRLKKLTEDLVEASKASSGNIKLNMEKIEVNELLKQVSAEFSDKFKERNLEEEITFTEEKVYINADSRYIYRVIENLYSNISKYAMDSSRVYVDIIQKEQNVIIQIKNISKEKLNISADELMQRFVRGDTSRNTEGSGLGLSIAESLVALQGGKFHIYLDGDLFKVTIGFKKV